jgi:signal transduction histidine kinase
MKRIILLLLFAILCLNTYAQQIQIDSLQRLLSLPQHNTSKIDTWNKISERYAYANPDSGIYYATKAQLLAKQVGDKKREAIALNYIGGCVWNKGNLSKALVYLKESIKIAQQINDESLIVNNLMITGLVYRSAENHRQSLHYYFQAQALLVQLPIEFLYPTLLSNIGRAYNYLEQYDSAIYFLEKSLLTFRKYAPKHQSIALINLGDVMFRMKRYETAKDYLLKGSEIAKTIYPRDLAASYRILAEIYLYENKLNIAEDYAKKAINAAQSGNFKYFMYQAYRVYANVLEAKKDIPNALKYKNLFILYRDSVYSEASKNSLQILEYEKAQGQIAILQKEKAMEIIAKQKQQNIFSLVSIFFILLCIILGYIIWQKQKTNQTLANQKIEILKQKEVLQTQSNILNELNIEKDKIFSIVAHDLRSPLASLKNIFVLLERNLLSQEEFQEMLPNLNKQISYSFDMTEELLYWARSQMNVIKVVPIKVNIADVFEEQINRLEDTARKKGVLLITQTTPDLSQAYVDIDMLKNVLRNLITNAIKFCNHGDKITLQAQNEDKFIKVAVKDTGIGISSENLSKLFTNANFTTRGTAGEKGTGLGLSLCKDFLEKNGGKIWVESIKNEGAAFYFTLPKA